MVAMKRLFYDITILIIFNRCADHAMPLKVWKRLIIGNAQGAEYGNEQI